MNREDIEQRIERACCGLYEQDKRLIDQESNEAGIVADALAPRLRNEFPEWDVNTTYNREGSGDDSKRDVDGNIMVPDIIIHRPGLVGPNIAVIEIKGFWNNENRAKDEDKLRRIGLKFNYEHLYRIELQRDGYELIRVSPV